MGYVVYEANTGLVVTDNTKNRQKVYRSEAAAQACKTRLSKKNGYQKFELAVCEQSQLPRRTKKVRNLMSGKMIEIDVNTPHCCDPSSETYWSM